MDAITPILIMAAFCILLALVIDSHLLLREALVIIRVYRNPKRRPFYWRGSLDDHVDEWLKRMGEEE